MLPIPQWWVQIQIWICKYSIQYIFLSNCIWIWIVFTVSNQIGLYLREKLIEVFGFWIWIFLRVIHVFGFASRGFVPISAILRSFS